MSIKDRLSHTAAVAKWKTDQQVRLIRSQNATRDIENKIGVLKKELGEIVVQLFSREQLSHDDLSPIYEKIVDFEGQIKEQHNIQEKIRNEDPPKPSVSSEKLLVAENSNLICPECKNPVAGKFCPEHGVEGIPLVIELENDNETTPKMICPECKRELSVRFCPEHGLEGIAE